MRHQDINSLIEYAKRFLVASPKLLTTPYPRSRKFDCSSFTQHVYGKHGIKLPRKVRDQAKQGIEVDKTDLKKGDLLFFYVPERFPTNDIPGHVGIYIGEGTMIHCLPSPKRVLISDLNTPHKKKTFLFAKRVILPNDISIYEQHRAFNDFWRL
ncbi:C40 family peptidase [Paenibacillus sp.]|uniref:C40 family peptidase n=1 Tax=Paenibacillus sp. TaxID=58172 RepID=UPI0039C8E23C